MTEHLPECPILKPCCDDEEWPEHGFCGNAIGGRCLHCMAECICDALRACEERVLEGRPDPGISEEQAIANYAIYQNGYAFGLGKARDALEAKA